MTSATPTLRVSVSGFLPSGRKRYFLHSQVKGHRVWHAIGDAGAITLARARSQAGALLALRHSGDETVPVASVMFEAVAEEVFRRYRRHWKSSTLAVNLSYYPGSGASQLPKSRAGSSCSG